MPKIIYYSRAFTWYLQNPRDTCHVSRNVSQRLSTLKVQKVQKPELFDLTENCFCSCDARGLICHIPHLCAIFQSNNVGLGPCVVIFAQSLRSKVSVKNGIHSGINKPSFITCIHCLYSLSLIENRQRRLQASAPGGMASHDHLLEKEKLIMILSTLFIHVVNLIYFRNLNHVSKFPWAIRLADRCNLLHCVWEIKNN